MPGEIIDRPNPKPLPSEISEEIFKFAVRLEKSSLPKDAVEGLKQFRRAACYIAAGTYLCKDTQGNPTNLSLP
jgi:xylulose-5-phosphate/fructose-6-phosphate phosphoketolase